MAPRPPAHRPPPATTPSSQDLVEELVATVAHELRRPLTALLGALATLQQRGPALPVAQQQELLALARRQGTQLQRLLEQLLVAAALDHPPPERARPLLVDAATLATEATVAAQLAHPNHRITVQAVGPLLVRVDPLAITRILGNLLDNAATHSPAGSPIQLIGSCDGTQVVLAVQDQGHGVAREASERIFERYARVDRRGGSAVGGLGLGLYISRRLALTNGGDLRLSDSPGGRGACFELRLPMTQPGADPHAGSAT
jgi:two-component system, OmpR family, sensor kinase